MFAHKTRYRPLFPPPPERWAPLLRVDGTPRHYRLDNPRYLAMARHLFESRHRVTLQPCTKTFPTSDFTSSWRCWKPRSQARLGKYLHIRRQFKGLCMRCSREPRYANSRNMEICSLVRSLFYRSVVHIHVLPLFIMSNNTRIVVPHSSPRFLFPCCRA